jgi:hypothetical protein
MEGINIGNQMIAGHDEQNRFGIIGGQCGYGDCRSSIARAWFQQNGRISGSRCLQLFFYQRVVRRICNDNR